MTLIPHSFFHEQSYANQSMWYQSQNTNYHFSKEHFFVFIGFFFFCMDKRQGTFHDVFHDLHNALPDL